MPLLLTDKWHISRAHFLGAFFFREMALNQTNHFQGLNSSVEEFMDGQENENAKIKTKHDVALFHEYLYLKGEIRQKISNKVSGFHFCISKFELP